MGFIFLWGWISKLGMWFNRYYLSIVYESDHLLEISVQFRGKPRQVHFIIIFSSFLSANHLGAVSDVLCNDVRFCVYFDFCPKVSRTGFEYQSTYLSNYESVQLRIFWVDIKMHSDAYWCLVIFSYLDHSAFLY